MPITSTRVVSLNRLMKLIDDAGDDDLQACGRTMRLIMLQ